MVRAALVEQEALEWVSQEKAKNSIALTFARADAKDLVWKVTLLEDELVEERRAQEASGKKHQEHFVELTLLQTQGSKLCKAIIGPPRARHLSEGTWLVALRHTEMDGELATFRGVVSSAAELVLERSPSKTTHTKVVGELAAEFQKVEGCCLKPERPAARICDLLLRPPPGQA
jgi:hypothetical protein